MWINEKNCAMYKGDEGHEDCEQYVAGILQSSEFGQVWSEPRKVEVRPKRWVTMKAWSTKVCQKVPARD